MSINRSLLAALTLIATFTVPLAQAQSLIKREVQPLRFKRVQQPDVDRYVPTDQDAFLMLKVTVGPDGVVKSADPLEGFFNPAQAAGARRLGMKLNFEPLMVDGRPMETIGVIPIVSRVPRGDPPMLPALILLLQDVRFRMARQDWAGALTQLDAAISAVRLAGQYCAVEALRAAAYEGSGSLPEALHHANEATRLRGGVIATDTARYFQSDTALLIQALEVKAKIQKTLGMYGDALDTHTELAYVQGQAKPAGVDEDISDLRNVIAGTEVISTSMSIDVYGTAAAKLIRPVLSLVDLPASAVTHAWVRCGHSNPYSWTHYEVPLDGKTWNRPDSAEDCFLQIDGQPNTRFKLLQSR